MSGVDGLELLKPVRPGLEAALEDPDISEIMINGPGNMWIEGHGRLLQIADAGVTTPGRRLSVVGPPALEPGRHPRAMLMTWKKSESRPICRRRWPRKRERSLRKAVRPISTTFWRRRFGDSLNLTPTI